HFAEVGYGVSHACTSLLGRDQFHRSYDRGILPVARGFAQRVCKCLLTVSAVRKQTFPQRLDQTCVAGVVRAMYPVQICDLQFPDVGSDMTLFFLDQLRGAKRCLVQRSPVSALWCP